MNKTTFTDRLRDRGFVDQWGFVAFAFLGFAAIVSAKALSIEATWVAVGAVAAMFLYALIIARAGTGRLGADQAGDNCYYLGLIYTLASLSYAIWTFDPGNTASTIVQGFGIALATTIAGLILRVFFNQGRPDLENIEEQTRLEMTDAVVRLKSELGDVVRQLNDFTRQVQQSMAELEESTKRRIEGFTNDAVTGLGEVVEAASATIRNEANDFATRSKRYSTTFDKLLAKLDRHADAVDHIREAHEVVQMTAKAAESAVGSAGEAVEALRESAEGARAAAFSSQEVVGSVKDLVTGLAVSVERMQSSFKEIHEETGYRISELRAGPVEGVTEAMGVLSAAADSLSTHISEVAALHSSAHAGIAAQNEAALETSRRLNDKLEAELERSQGLVGKVHSSLADMTSRLADAVETSP